MNLCLNILVLCGLLSSSFQQDQTLLDSEWETYKRDFNKTYATPEEEAIRKNNFIENWKKIIEHNELFEKGKITYEAGTTEEDDLDPDEIADSLDGVDYANELPDKTTITMPQNDENEGGNEGGDPKFVDWRKKGLVTPVRNQRKRCASSWAMAVNAILETRMIRFGVSINNIDFSEQQILDCGNSGDCKGGAPFKFLKSLATLGAGVCGENAYRYRAKKRNCKRKWKEEGYLVLGTDYYKHGTPNEEQLETMVSGFGPMIMGIVATENFVRYKKGIFATDPKCTSDKDPNHMVLVVGFGETKSGTKYWIIKNSFGKKWGENGYMRMLKNRNFCKAGNYFGAVGAAPN